MIRFSVQQTRTLLLAAPALASSVLHCSKVGLSVYLIHFSLRVLSSYAFSWTGI